MSERDDDLRRAVIMAFVDPRGGTEIEWSPGASAGHITQAAVAMLYETRLQCAAADEEPSGLSADLRAVHAWATESIERYMAMVRARESAGSVMIRPTSVQ